MSQVISFVAYVPPVRYDDEPWTTARIQEAAAQAGPWTLIDTQALSPVDADPTAPAERNLTTDDADDEMGLWYRIVWVDGNGALSPTLPVQNLAPETLSPLALCTEDDVRLYLGLDGDAISEDDRNTLIRLVNAASEVYTAESQRLWKADPDEADTVRLYRLDSYDIAVGRVRIDDANAITSVSHGSWRSMDAPTELDVGSWYGWQEEPDWPITGIVFGESVGLAEGLTFYVGDVLSVDADWGWASVPERVRQSVIYTAAEWYARDVEKFSATFSLDQGRILLPQVLPSQVQREAEGWRRWRVA